MGIEHTAKGEVASVLTDEEYLDAALDDDDKTPELLETDQRAAMMRILEKVGLSRVSEEPLTRKGADGQVVSLLNGRGEPLTVQDYFGMSAAHTGALDYLVSVLVTPEGSPEFPEMRDGFHALMSQYLPGVALT